MIDHLLGRPSVSWKRSQVFLVILFWVWRLVKGSPDGPRILWIRKLNRILARFTPWQIIVSALTGLYAVRHMDNILGLAAPEPLARLYSRNYYRSTWIATGLDAGFATAMNIRPKWLRDLSSVAFSLYYIVYANEADEKLRKYRAVCTVEMLRVTWEKSVNPYLRALSWFDRPRLGVFKKVLLGRPRRSKHDKPISAWVFFAGTEDELARSAREIILDFPGGGFIAMNPAHHEERLRFWAVQTRKVVVAIDYGKAPEYPYPWAIEEGFDVYQTIVETKGKALGLSGRWQPSIILTGDSAGGNLVTNIMFKIIESPTFIPRPIGLVLSYPALDFNFTSWMSPSNLRVLRSEQSSSHIPGLIEQKDHFGHKSPLSVVDDVSSRRLRRKKSWARSFSEKLPFSTTPMSTPVESRVSSPVGSRKFPGKNVGFFASRAGSRVASSESDGDADAEEDEEYEPLMDHERPILERVRTSESLHKHDQAVLREAVDADQKYLLNAKKVPMGTRLTMTSRTGYFQDRIISPSMMRAMAILYIGPSQNPDFETDYYISPILAPNALLVEFPPTLINCGEKDPFVDDTVIFAGRLREAKRARRMDVERAVASRANRLGESLRMSSSAWSSSCSPTTTEAEILAETEDDWVQMRIIEGWSHGYLQMLTLMPESKLAVQHLADWMDSLFSSRSPSTSSTPTSIPPAAQRSERPVQAASPQKQVRRPSKSTTIDLGQGVPGGDTEPEKEEILTFTPRKRRSPPPPFSRQVHEGEVNGSLKRGKGKISSSSEETLTGPGTPDTALHRHTKVRVNGDSGNSPLMDLEELSGHHDDELVISPRLPPSPSTKPLPAAVQRLSIPGGETRAGTPVLAGGKAAGVFLSEGELMKRRRLEAVHGLVAGDGVVDATQPSVS